MAIKLLFRRSSLLGLRTTFFVVLSLIFMMVDHHYNYLASFRSVLSLLTVPVKYLVDGPVELINTLGTHMSTSRKLLQQNAHLQANQLILSAKLQQLLAPRVLIRDRQHKVIIQ